MSDLKESRIDHQNYFIDHENGTVTDTRSGLMWKRAIEKDQSTKYFKFNYATNRQFDFAGHSDWRLPTIDELKALTSIDAEVFPGTPKGYFWTSTPDAADHQNRWQVDFLDGKVYSNRISVTAYIRLVRNTQGNALTIKIDSVELTTAETAGREYFSLDIIKEGTGTGTIVLSPNQRRHEKDRVVMLQAIPAVGSVFKGWIGEGRNEGKGLAVRMDAAKTISAMFEKIPSFSLSVITTGNGSGTVKCNPDADEYVIDSIIKLTAYAADGSRFNGWRGDTKWEGAVGNVKMNAAKKLEAEFVLLKFYKLTTATCGKGFGIVKRSLDAESYPQGSSVTLTAYADDGFIFNGWQGDASGSGMETSCTIAMDSSKSVTAEFIKLDVIDLGVDVRFDTATDAKLGNGEAAFTFYLSVANHAEKQVHVELPLASYVTRNGEEVEQTNYISGLLPVNKKSAIRAGAFRKIGLVFFKSRLPEITIGDHLHVIIFQAKPARRLSFTFRCTAKNTYQFILIKSLAEDTLALDENGETSLEKLEILQRLTLLEDGMRDILRKLDALQIPSTPIISNRIQLATTQTLSEVLTWLSTQDRVSLAALRGQLLPLDLLPNAIMDQLNERALDLTGELALEEIDDEIVVSKEIIDEVLANWNMDPS